MAREANTLLAYKGFDKNWKCRGFQYEVGKSYEHDGDVELCRTGFHACEYPLDVFNYYDPTGQLAVVELGGVVPAADGDSKRAGKSITIKASLTIPTLVSAAIEYTTSRCNPVKAKYSTGYQSASSATGKSAVAMNIGRYGKAMAGKDGAIVLRNHDDNGDIRHIRASKVGENGIKTDVFYVLNDAGEFVAA